MKNNNWTAFHVFLSDADKTTDYIASWLAPYCEDLIKSGLADSWFFIRYWDGGPHIRIRLNNLKSPVSEIKSAIELAVAAWQSEAPTSKDAYFSGHSFDGEAMNIENLKWYGEGAVEVMPYEPEYFRYGGEDAMSINEALFEQSSRLATALLRSHGNDNQKLALLSIKMMIATMLAVDCSVALVKESFYYYAKYWETYSERIAQLAQSNTFASNEYTKKTIESLVKKIDDETMSTDSAGPWYACVQIAVKQFRDLALQEKLISPITGIRETSKQSVELAIANMLGSQIHMLNNRLGILPEQEFILSNIIVESAQECLS